MTIDAGGHSRSTRKDEVMLAAGLTLAYGAFAFAFRGRRSTLPGE